MMVVSVAGVDPCVCPMSGRSPGPRRALKGAPCLCLLQQCLAVHLQKVGLVSRTSTSPQDHPPQQYWMYDSGYLVFQVSAEHTVKTNPLTVSSPASHNSFYKPAPDYLIVSVTYPLTPRTKNENLTG